MNQQSSKSNNQKFVVAIPVKPYVKRFIEVNYGLPADFSHDQDLSRLVNRCLKKPDTRYEKKYDQGICTYTETLEILISQDQFYRYGWEFSKTDVVAFGQEVESSAKTLMRSMVGVYHAIGLPINVSIEKFQTRFGFDEDVWNYQTIKKDFYRNGTKNPISFDDEIFKKIEQICLVNLYNQGTISKKGIKEYEAA